MAGQSKDEVGAKAPAKAAVDKRSGVKIEGVPEGIAEISAGGLSLPVEKGVVWVPPALVEDVKRHVRSFLDAAKRAEKKLAQEADLADLKTNLIRRIERIEAHLGIKL